MPAVLAHPAADAAVAIERLAARAGQLYSLPSVAMKVLELTNRSDVDARALKDCIELDPALTGKLLRVVNSSLFGLSRQVTDLNQAIALLGSKPLKLLVLGFSLPSGLLAGVTAEVLGRYWRHALTKAVAARELSETLWNCPGDDAFIAALLQDVGLLVLVQQLGEPYVRLIEKVIARKQEITAMETASMGFSHTQLSARLLEQWGLPETIVAAVAYRPDLPRSALSPAATIGEGIRRPQSDLAKIVYLAELLARLLVDGQPHWLPEILELVRQQRDLTRGDLESLVARLQEKVDQLADVLRLQLSDGRDYQDVLVAAHAQLSVVAAETAEQLLRSLSAEDLPPEDAALLDDFQAVSATVARAVRDESPRRTPVTTVCGKDKSNEADLPHPQPFSRKREKGAETMGGESLRRSAAPTEEIERQLAVAVAACRQSRCPLSLMLVELDNVASLTSRGATNSADAVARWLKTLSDAVDHNCKIVMPYSDQGFALVLPQCERPAAIELGYRLLELLKSLAPRPAAKQPALTASVGIGTVSLLPRNFPPSELLRGAVRCLSGSHASGGGVVKSIEIY